MGDTPEGDLQYVNHRYERGQREDGRRCHSWFLTDQFGTEHLAVLGVETDTMDGHYSYQALEPFASRLPLNCGNQSAVVKYLQEWLAGGISAGTAEQHPTYSGGASSMATASAPLGRRKAFSSSLCSSRAAILNAAGVSPIHHHHHTSGGSGRGKKKGSNQTAMATYAAAPGSKQKAVGIVQQNQIKKARKIQQDIRAEHDRLVASHLLRLRRAAAAELQADSAAKQVSMSWLQGSLPADELDALEHWRSLLAAVLDLQDQKRQQQEAAAGEDRPSNPQPQQQQQQQEKAGVSSSGGGDPGSATGTSAAGAVGAGVPEKLLVWLQQPDSRRHHLRVTMECLRELAAAEVPARVLLQHKLIALVQRCKCEHQPDAVKSLAEVLLTRWRWQLAGHMQVLREPVYMQDHLGVLEEDINAGLVPLPTLPRFKQALLDTALPIFPGGPGGRGAYTPAHSNQQAHYHHHMQHSHSTPQLYDAAASAAAGYQALTGYPGFAAGGSAAGLEAAGASGYGAFNLSLSGFYTPMPSLSGVQAGGSPSSGPAAAAAQAAAVQSGQQHLALYGPGSAPAQLGQILSGQQEPQQVLASDAAADAAATAATAAVGLGACGLDGLQQVLPAGSEAAAAAPASSTGCAYSMTGAGNEVSAATAGILGGHQAAVLAVQQLQQ